MSKTKEQRHAAVHARALERFAKIQSALRDERLQCLQDRRFYSLAGAQWEGNLGADFENRPRFEVNKVHLSVIRVINEYRNNRISVDFTAKDGSEDDLADVCDGLYRADEQRSTADEAYDNAFEESVGGGFGAWRLRACYEDEYDDENDRQVIRIEPIFDADNSVFFDLDAKRQDKADANHCFVITSMSPAAYSAEYDDDPASWPKEIQQKEFDWATPDVVYVAEYYEVEEVTEVVHIFRGLDDKDMRVPAAELEEDPDKLDTLLATGFREVRQKRVKRRKVHKYILSGGKVLEDEGFIAGECIPIIPTYGKRWFVDNVERCMGHVRLAKDAQRLTNVLMSWLGEMASRFDMEKPIFTPEQVRGHATMWAQDNLERFPYLLLNPIKDGQGNIVQNGPIGYTKAPAVPQAMAALMQLAEQSLQDVLGNQQAGEVMQPQMSGKAVELIQNRLDMQVFIYTSNFAKAMRRSGEVWLSMSKAIRVEESRREKVIDAQGQPGSVVLNEPAYDPSEGREYVQNDMSAASFDVVPDVGPSSSSRKAATVRALTGLASITDDPEIKQALMTATIANIEGEGLGDLNDWARARGIRMGLIKPTEEEQKQLAEEAANQQPDPNTQYLLKAAEAEAAKAVKARADTVKVLTDADLSRAKTAQIASETATAERAEQFASVQALHEAFSGQLPPSAQ